MCHVHGALKPPSPRLSVPSAHRASPELRRSSACARPSELLTSSVTTSCVSGSRNTNRASSGPDESLQPTPARIRVERMSLFIGPNGNWTPLSGGLVSKPTGDPNRRFHVLRLAAESAWVKRCCLASVLQRETP